MINWFKQIIDSDFIQKGFCQNRWLWVHLIELIAYWKITKIWLLWSNPAVIGGAVTLMILNEIAEYYIEGHGKLTIEATIYGSIKGYLYDTMGDLLLPSFVLFLLLL